MKLLTKSVVVATVLCFVAGLSAGAAVSSYSPGAGDLFAGENLLALPVVPTDLDGSGRGPGYPEFILSPIDVAGTNLQRWDTAAQAWLSRSSASFGNLLSSDGYKLVGDGNTFSFNGANDLQQTDYWISLPKTGTTVVGNPYLYSVDWTKIAVTNGMETVSIDTAISTKGWLVSVNGFDNGHKVADVAIGPISSMPAQYSDSTTALAATRLEPWRGYSVTSLVDNLALIVTARKTADTDKYKVSGTINFDGFPVPACPVIIELRSSDGATKLVRTIKHVSSGGEYVLDGIAPGTYTVAVKGRTTLAAIYPAVTVTASDVTLDVALINGDINGDNFIEESDFAILNASWYTDPSSGIYYNADLNGDYFVEESDFAILNANWYQGGDGEW